MRETPRAAATDEQKRAAVEHARSLMLGGASQNKAAGEAGAACGVTGRTIINWAVAQGEPLPALSQETAKTAALHAARQAKDTYSQERRLALSDKAFSRFDTLLENCTEARDFKDLMTGFGIATDKRRLEEGLVTDRASIEQRQAAEAETAALGELHARLRLVRGGA